MMDILKTKFNFLYALIFLLIGCQPQVAETDPEIALAKHDSVANIETFDTANISMFPLAKKGFKQVLIKLPIKENEADLKLEFYAGLTLDVDCCNSHFLTGNTKLKNLDGWGYTYYEVESDGSYGSTKMACPDTTTKKEFVHLDPTLVQYNSKLPVVLYVPEKFSVQYRIWKADQKFKNTSDK